MNFHSFFAKRRQEASLRQWVEDLPEGFVDCFLQNLQKFLYRYGYTIQINERLKGRFIAWAWSHAFIYCSPPEKKLKLKSPQMLHHADKEEFDHYCYLIDYENWETFMDTWQTFRWLDETDIGQLQRADFQYFVWTVLDLGNSPAHHRWCDFTDYHSDDSDKEGTAAKLRETDVYEQAYGGDRRTL